MANSVGPELRRLAVGRLWRILVTFAWASVVAQLWGLYRVTGPPTPEWFPNADKLEHGTAFAMPVAFILLAVWLRRRLLGAPFRDRVIAIVAGIFVAHAVISELIQHFFYVTRTGDPRDVLADCVGVGIGVGIFLLIRQRTTGPRRA